jgi:hypothetical protein
VTAESNKRIMERFTSQPGQVVGVDDDVMQRHSHGRSVKRHFTTMGLTGDPRPLTKGSAEPSKRNS